jgi:hypothetical protein
MKCWSNGEIMLPKTCGPAAPKHFRASHCEVQMRSYGMLASVTLDLFRNYKPTEKGLVVHLVWQVQIQVF